MGLARVGVASCDPDGVLATPVATLTRDLEGADDIDELVRLVGEQEAIEVVVGLPLSLSGGEGAAATAVRDYARVLGGRLGAVPVRLVDERLTTVDAHRDLRASGVSGRAQRAVVDQAAAVLILQGALDLERSSGNPPGELVPMKRRKPRTKDGR